MTYLGQKFQVSPVCSAMSIHHLFKHHAVPSFNTTWDINQFQLVIGFVINRPSWPRLLWNRAQGTQKPPSSDATMLNPRIELGAVTDWLRERCSSSSGPLVNSFEDEGFRICSDEPEEEGFGSGWLPLHPRLKPKEKSLACPSMSDSFVRFIVLCRTLQEWHTVRWAIEEDKKCWYHREPTFFFTPAVGLRAELEKKAVVDHSSVEVVPTGRLSCTRWQSTSRSTKFLCWWQDKARS